MTNYEVLKIHGSQMALSQLQLLLTRLGTRPTPDRPPLIVYPGHGGLHSGGLWDGGDRSTLWLLPCPWSFRWFLHLSAACCSRLLRGRPSSVLRRSWGPGRPGLGGGGGGRGRRSRCQEPASLVSVSCGPGRSGLSGSVWTGSFASRPIVWRWWVSGETPRQALLRGVGRDGGWATGARSWSVCTCS